MVLINGRNFACEACIRGHRASSCAHTGRQLQLVRKKGRPASQCDVCRSKRVNGSFHGRCDCNLDGGDEEEQEYGGGGGSRRKRIKTDAVETFMPFADLSGSSDGDSSETQPGESSRSSKGKHSLDLLMNPCQCRSTGICSCCSRTKETATHATLDRPASCGCNGGDTCCSRTKETATHATLDRPASCGCNGGDTCCSDGLVKCGEEAVIEVETGVVKSCCSGSGAGKAPKRSDAGMPSLTAEQAAILHPECQCGPNCSCPGCLNDLQGGKAATDGKGKAEEDCPNRCMDCSACVLGLTRPSGIDAVDQWMEQEKRRTSGKGDDKQITGISSSITAHVATRFHDEHFNDPKKREYFAQHLAAAQMAVAPVTGSAVPVSASDIFGDRLPGESNEQWKARHGFQYLTPEAVEIFDHARKFKEKKALAERQQERLEADSKEELSQLRERALAGRKGARQDGIGR